MRRLRRRVLMLGRSEAGFTMTELTIALSLLAVVMTSVAGVFVTSMKSASTNNRRSTAYSLATKSLEGLRALPYVKVGFYDDQVPVPVTFDPALPTVSLGAATPADTTVIPTEESVTIAPLTYTVKRYIVWSDATSATGVTLDDAYKRLRVVVTWTDQIGMHTVRQDSLLYPGARGPYTVPQNNQPGGGTTTTTVLAPLAPNQPENLIATVPPAPNGETQIDLSWSAPTGGPSVAYYRVQQAPDDSFVTGVISYPQQTGLTFSATGLGDNTTYSFRVLAYSSTDEASLPSNVVTATTRDQTAAVCQMSSLSVTGASSSSTSKTYVDKQDGTMSENLNLSVSFTGSCSGTFAVQATNPAGTADPGSPFGVSGSSGSTRSGVAVSTGQTWALGVHAFAVLLNGSVTSPPVTKTFLVCAYLKPSDRSSNPNAC